MDRDPNVSLSFAKAEVIAGPLIQLIDVSFGYGAKAAASKGGHGDGAALFEGVNLNVDSEWCRVCSDPPLIVLPRC